MPGIANSHALRNSQFGPLGMSYNLPSLLPPEPPQVKELAWVYVLQSADGSFYVGQSCNVGERLRKHRLGLGSKHTHDHIELRLVFIEGPFPLIDAVRRERQLKGWSRDKKIALITGDLAKLRTLARRRT